MESPEQAPPSAVPLREAQMLDALNRHAATGLRFVRARRLEGKATPRPIRIQYELPLDASQMEAVRGRLGELASQEQWLVDRLVSNSHRPVKRWDKQQIDIKPLIEQVDLADARLTWTARRQGEAWARPGELLALVGLDSRTDLARVVRTFVTYENDPLSPAPSAPESPADTSAAERGNEQGNIDQHR